MSAGRVPPVAGEHMSFIASLSRKYIKSLPAYFAYGLEDGYGMLEVANVEYWDHQFDICIVANAIDRIEAAGLAKCVLLCRSLR